MDVILNHLNSTLVGYFLYTEEHPIENVFRKHAIILFEIKVSFKLGNSLK